MKEIYFLIIVIIISSCTLDYSDTEIVETLSDEIPNTIIYKYETVEFQNGSPSLEIKADKAEVYNSKEKTYLTKVEFYNYKDDLINNRGKSDSAILNMKSGDAELTGSIEVKSEEDHSSLKAESLIWVDKNKNLASNPEDLVTVTDKKGSELKGRGFSADIKRKTILFEKEIEGEFISNEEN